MFAAPKITCDPEADLWRLFYAGIVKPCSGNHFNVFVDGKTDKASVRHGE